ncbi:MAG: PQQ-like beta-propeller repeat protein, partial [Candidatus Bathyarchaeota archaeon]|nr:PQQ-like beta-propeller repeat protein [Candidatus Bathyarchaeota archaeon]
LIWNYTTGDAVASSPAVVGGVVYVGSYDRKIYALNASTGALVWNYATGDMVVSSPAVTNGIVYVGSYDHLVYAFGPSPNAQTYSVTFTESGLPSGTSWNVTFNSQTQSSTLNSIMFSVPNGVYAFSITPPTDYTASPSSGSVTVKGENINLKIRFTPTSPDFPSLIVLSLFIMAILLAAVLLAVVLYRRRKR